MDKESDVEKEDQQTDGRHDGYRREDAVMPMGMVIATRKLEINRSDSPAHQRMDTDRQILQRNSGVQSENRCAIHTVERWVAPSRSQPAKSRPD